MKTTVIKNARLINEGSVIETDLLIRGERIEKIGPQINVPMHAEEMDLKGKLVFPGAIDDQVHFREPGLTHKGEIYTESRAAAAGGVTTYMEMPNTVPNALTQRLLQDKYDIASARSLANYSFFMGASNDNLDEVLRTDPKNVCGVKVFMGSSTGNMLVDSEKTLEGIFANSPTLIATHCEDEATIRRNTAAFRERYGEGVPFSAHPLIRSEEACYLSSSLAVSLAKKFGAQLHILHISTAKELELFDNTIPLEQKKITAEACIHHLWFSEEDYASKGSLIKWNPAVKKSADREAIFAAVLDGRIDVIATDHAPHTLEEKANSYFGAPSGGPLVQHSLMAMMDFYHQGKITLPQIAQKMAHNVAILFKIEDRGFIREGYYADLAIVDPETPYQVNKNNILAKCGWSPFEGHTFPSSVHSTFISGHLAWHNGKLDNSILGKRITFKR